MNSRTALWAFVLAAAGLQFFAPDDPVFTALFLVVPVTSVYFLTNAARHRRAGDPVAWGTFALGLGFYTLAEVAWLLQDIFDRDPFPSEADLLFVAGLVTLIVGLLMTSTRISPVRDMGSVIDAGAVGVAASSLAWHFVIEPAAASLRYSSVNQAGMLVELIVDVALLTVVSRLALSTLRATSTLRLIYSGIALSVGAGAFDIVFEVGTGIDLRGKLDGVVLLGIGLWALAGDASLRWNEPIEPARSEYTPRRLMLLAGAAFTPLIVLVAHQLSGIVNLSGGLVFIVLASVVAASLVIVRVGGLLSIAKEITAAEGRDRLAALIEHSADAILTVDAALQIQYASPSVRKVLGLESSSLVGRQFSELVSGAEVDLVRSRLLSLLGPTSRESVQFRTRIAFDERLLRDFDAVAVPLPAQLGIGIVVTMRDVTAQLTLERELRVRAFHDQLTGLPNRALFYDRLGHALARRHEHGDGAVAVLLLDLDEFKLVNDGLGHAAGDEILVAVSKRLAGCVRSGDTVARLGGDEFVLLLEDPTSTSHAERMAQLLLEVLETPLRAGPLELPIRGSIGIALAQEDSTPESLIQDADIAMYAAKSSPSNSTMLFTEPMRHAATRRIEMRSELERAIGTDALRLLYQPIVDLQRDMPAGFEALLRWTHPERGAISPVEFIPLAEQSQLIGRIGRQVLFEATHQAALWNSEGRMISMSVNVSAIQFQEPGLVDEVREALSRSGLSPRNLTLELTETALMGDPQATETALIALRGMGVKLAIDDFGTGQCSLTYIKRFAPDSLKIDRAFVTEITDTGTQTLLAHGILRLADGLGIRCVAEGIETIEQATNLRAHGCAYGQGYLFSRPIDAVAAGSYLSAHRAAEVAMKLAGPTSSARR